MKSNADFKVIIGLSKKDPSRKYYMLVADLGYTRKVLSFDLSVIAEIVGESVSSLIEYEVGEYIL